MKVKLRWTIRLKAWAAKAAKKVARRLVSILAGIAVMVITMDSMGIYLSQQTAGEIAARAAVAASHVLRQGGDRIAAEREARLVAERGLAKFGHIEFRDPEVEVIVVYQARSLILKGVPWLRKYLTITASGSYPTS